MIFFPGLPDGQGSQIRDHERQLDFMDKAIVRLNKKITLLEKYLKIHLEESKEEYVKNKK